MNRSSDSTLFGSAIIRRLGVLALVGGTCLVGGCLSDSELNDQKSAQTEIEAASTRYATLISEVGVEKTPLIIADGLDKVVREVKSIKGTSSQQKKLITKMAGQISAAAGKLRAMALVRMNLDLRGVRAQIAAKADSAMIIAAGAETRIQTDFDSPTEQLSQQRDGFQQPHEQIRSENSKLESQIAQVRQQRDRSSQQLDQMTTDSARLTRQANNVSAIDGYPLVEESSEIRAKMIPIKTTIADAEIQLAGMQPELQRQQTVEMNAKALIDATHRAEANIDSIKDAVVAAGQTGRERARTQVEQLNTLLEQYGTMQSEEFDPLFTATIENLNQAQRSGSSKSERQIAGEATVLIGELHALQAFSDAEDARLYTTLANTSSITNVDPAKWSALAEEASTASKASIEEARTAYGDALEKLSRVDGNQAALESIEQLIKALDGVRIERTVASAAPAPMNTTAPAMPASAAPAAGNFNMPPFGTNGASSPQAIMDFVNQMGPTGGNMEQMQQFLGMMYISDPSVLPKLQSLQQGGDLFARGATGPMVLKNETATTALIQLPGTEMGLPLKKVDGKWYIDVNQLVELMEQTEGRRGGGRGRG